ncbi:MAG: chemotaxis protein CheW [Coleofasciculus sp. A1-SPW-01]|uniref:chemotaxis protein CheW n=1 Tax=Coleofasciculus sp. A1-SPW-01 TaxID=3070819 RepID=UPI0032F75C88
MTSDTQKYIVFKISDCLISLPMDNVLKVLNTPSNESGWNAMGLLQIGDYTIRIVDLHQQLNPDYDTNSTNLQSFLVITNPIEGDLFGIIVDEPPNLIELNPDLIRKLPKYNRRLPMVSHAAVLQENEKKTTIFMLDLFELFNPVA